MRTNYILPIVFMACLGLFITSSCSESDNEYLSGIEVDAGIKDISEASIDLVSKCWEKDIDFVKAQQNNALILVYEDTDFLKYTNNEKSFFISYGFSDNRLQTSLLLVPTNSTQNPRDYNLSGYGYIGNLDGSALHISADESNVASVLSNKIDDKEYVAIGFTPLNSDLFANIEPIVVTTLPAINVDKTSMTLCGSYTGMAENPQAVIYYSLDQDLYNYKQYKCSITDGKFEKRISGLTPNSTIYFKAVVFDDGINYDGSIESAQLAKQSVYKIGELYPDVTNPIGVVFEISNGGTNGKIVSFDYGYNIKWDVNGFFAFASNGTSTTDGLSNTNKMLAKSASPAARWCSEKGDGWYCPARSELVKLSNNLSPVNTTLKSLGYDEHEGFYWSSTEHSSNTAYIVCVTTTYYIGYSGGWYGYNTKDQTQRVCAIKQF